ncbi:MAG: hypothetical protein AB7T49_10270 [Oligoflexales bacterium]
MKVYVRRSIVAAIIAFLAQSCKTSKSNSSFKDEGSAPSAYRLPDAISPEENLKLWTKYCVVDPATAESNEVGMIPDPNYNDPLVKQAAQNLSRVNRLSFSLYSIINVKHINRKHKPANVSSQAHDFVTYLCGEFRDRATMIESKLAWVSRMNYLPNKPGSENTPNFDPKKDEWAQMTAQMYQPYYEFTEQLFQARVPGEKIDLGVRTRRGEVKKIDRPIPPLTVCENRYIFANYVSKKKQFQSLEDFDRGYAPFKQANCGPNELDYYLDFRGDSNIKPNSPEGNGMIWYSRSIALQCYTTTRSVADLPEAERKALQTKGEITKQHTLLKNEDCIKYYREPFKHRWLASRSALGAWVLYGNEHVDAFYRGDGGSGKNLRIIPPITSPLTAPSGVSAINVEHNLAGLVPAKMLSGANNAWLAPDMGLMDYANQQESATGAQENISKAFIYKRLSGAVDTHTDWYSSGYNDQLNQEKPRDCYVDPNSEKCQAYSPFVASSYEMSQSNNFTAPGLTVPAFDPKAEEFKHIMLVFKIHKNNWYTSEDISKGRNIDFDRMWFDETSLGNTDLAKSEKGWDRLGTSLEAEHHTILYLANLCTSGKIRNEGEECYPEGEGEGVVEPVTD